MGAHIVVKHRPVFFAPTRRRHFLTLKGAAMAEAGALIAKKYPTESPEYHEGRMTYAGFHYTTDERLIRVRHRLARRILRAEPIHRRDGDAS